MAMTKFPGKPDPAPKLEVLTNEVIYTLKFLRGNGMENKLIRFDEELNIVEVIKAAKRYCEVNRFRFVFIEPAITTIPTNIEEDFVE